MLSVDEEEGNKELSSDRVIVENFFGRLNGLWEVTSRKYRWAEEIYDPILHLCVALTNIHIFWHPLRDQDGERYQQVRNKWFTLGEGMLKKRKLNQQRYRDKRQRRPSRDLGGTGLSRDAYAYSDDDSSTMAP